MVRDVTRDETIQVSACGQKKRSRSYRLLLRDVTPNFERAEDRRFKLNDPIQANRLAAGVCSA